MPSGLAVAAITTAGYAGILICPAGVGFVAKNRRLPMAFLDAHRAPVPRHAFWRASSQGRDRKVDKSSFLCGYRSKDRGSGQVQYVAPVRGRLRRGLSLALIAPLIVHES